MDKSKRGKKCQSLNSPKAVGGFPRGKCMRAEALKWNGWKNMSLEANQSFPGLLPTQCRQMEWFRGDGVNLASFTSRKWAFNQSPIHVSSSRDEAWLLNETSLNTSTHPSNSLFEGSLPLPNLSKAVLTIALPSTQILIVNSVACKLLGYTAEELCALRLRDLLVDPQQFQRSKHEVGAGLDISDTVHHVLPKYGTGSVVELLTRDKIRIPVFLFFKKIDTPNRCVAAAELVDRRVATLSVDSEGKVVNFDEEVTAMFQYEGSELRGLNLNNLIPSVSLPTASEKDESGQQKLTGRTKTGGCFPLCLVARSLNDVEDASGWNIILWVYSNLSGVIILNLDLSIANCNHLFTSLLFGYSKENLLNQSIMKLLPGFWEDNEYERNRTMTADQSVISECEPTGVSEVLECDRSLLPQNSVSSEQKDIPANHDRQVEVRNSAHDWTSLIEDLYLDSTGEEDSNASIIKDTDLDLQNEMIEKLTCLNQTNFQPWQSNVRLRSSRSDDILAKKMTPNTLQALCTSSNLDLKSTGLQDFPMNRALHVPNLSEFESPAVPQIREGTFAGRGRHRDGADIDVVYRVREARGGKGYYVCVARDPWESAEGGRDFLPNLTITCSFNSTSLESSLNKDSEVQSRPNSASIISQSDDILTSGEYSEYYTNLQQIGKGAFGYVKMAYRNEDGLLVITKFIKKHKIHARSWVVDPTLKMKVPLEISLLYMLEHPNIVSTLQVFENEAFFQLVMEKHGSGMDLFEFIDRKPKMDEKLGSYIFRQMISAVHYLHSLGILHRDIKDENVIINETFHIKLIDFGSAAFMSPGRLFSTFYGTVEYCSPEVLQGNKYRGPELEVWALGVTLYVLIFGENPFYDVEETIKGDFVIPRPISSQLFSLIKGMLEKNVELRWDMEKIRQDPWVNLPVDPGNYSFQKVVRCYRDEAFPAKYISAFSKDDVCKEEEDDDRTVASSNSFCSLHTLENLDEPGECCDSFDPCSELATGSVMLSSTPRRASESKSISSVNCGAEEQAHKRFSLDLNTLKKLHSVQQKDARTNGFMKSDQPGCNTQEQKPRCEDVDSYWDAEDEQYDEDSC